MTDTAGPQFILSGGRGGTSPFDQGTLGRYWSSLAYADATFAYSLGLRGTNSTVYPANNSYKLYGFSLRCLAQNQIRKNKAL